MLKNAKSSVRLLLAVFLAVFVLFSMIMAINIGAVDINPRIIFSIIANRISHREIFGADWTSAQESIVWSLRFPKVIVAGCVGAGLSLAGIFMQALTKNPLADPYILGISSGASAGAVASLLLGSLPLIGKLPLPAGAFFGALLTAVLVFVIGGGGIKGSTTRLVLIGMAISAFFSALTDLIIFLTPDSKKVTSAMFWMTGSFAGVSWSDVLPAVLTLAAGIFVAAGIRKEMDALLMGEELARNYGVNVPLVKVILIGTSTLLTAVMVSMSGIIGFVGLVVPHVSRQVMGAAHAKMLPAALLAGAGFMIWADVIARVSVAPEELPVGVVTAIAGAPFFLMMLRKSRYEFGK
ncbi:MAG: iron ABC transporter permease [Lachnospiraceae bacterium]|nr:iron ABC transporter permease [Lachnospiraceae bacterium]